MRHSKLLILASLLQCGATSTATAPLAPGDRAEVVQPFTEAALKERVAEQFRAGGPARAALDKLAAEDRFSGVVAISLGNETVFAGNWGLADRSTKRKNRQDTRFDLASTGKLFTVVAIGQLVDQRKIGFEDRVGQHLKGLPPALASVTIEQLLTHRSGLHSYFDSPLWPTLSAKGATVADYMQAVLADTPSGAGEFQYSNSGFVLLGAVIEAVSGETYFDYVSRNIFAPAGMTSTGYETTTLATDAMRYTKGCFARPPSMCTLAPDWQIEPRPLRGTPAGGAYSTAADMTRFAQGLRNGLLMSRSSLDEMSKRKVDLGDGGPADGQGLGFAQVKWADGKIELFGHNGATPGSATQLDMTIDPAVTIVVLTNADGALRQVLPVIRNALFNSGP